VPAIWEDSAKQFMREAAIKVCNLILSYAFHYTRIIFCFWVEILPSSRKNVASSHCRSSLYLHNWLFVGWLMVFNATFNNISVTCISWRSVLLVEETKVPRENHRSVTNHWQVYRIILYQVHLATLVVSIVC